ncbi:Na dependent nucleoside transporter [Penicillium cf. griseofulvum]|uniref:Na dependent nucleoside transporter n=1 Tax=Penicillium cf. griseofulvum TaxID=2972120 RepID=A0A9W9MS24_9EURO|nr:Na dependent nucleoside transporter [Penicillium cf. griseofulvum]KAJ5440688.1 Na dependent nucleoside transporter [Penicillium cf. griseofulvum]KAJ5448737.1 Na dependent nucleoside transporter [Penicillium cf. griseofulvum]
MDKTQDPTGSEVAHHVDPVLDPENQHHHAHQHHTAFAEQGRQDEVVYTKDVPFEKEPEPTPLEQRSKNSDEETGENLPAQRTWYRRAGKQWRHMVHAVVWLLFTGWWIAGLILHRHDIGWLIPFLLYLAITLRILFFYIPITIISKPMHWVWERTAHPFVRLIPEKLRTLSAATLCIGVILIGAFASEESLDNTRENRAVSLFGMIVCIFGLWATSRNRKKIIWHTVIVGMLAQFIIALFVLRTTAGYDIFNFISELARHLLDFAVDGVIFLTSKQFYEFKGGFFPSQFFLITVCAAIVFFVSFVQLLFHWGVIQWFIGKFAVFFFWSMRVSGAEAVVAAASPFIGQGESAMLIRPFIAHLTMAELHQIMCSGFATIAGSVLIAYISIGVNAQAMVSACVMSIPASLAVSKMRWPEEEETLTAGRVIIPDDEEHRAANSLHAFTNGTWLGLKIAAMITSTLLCIIALIGLVNGLLTWWGRYLNINDPTLTLELIVGYICYPIAFLLGVSRDKDLLLVGKLIGTKLVTNEFVAYDRLQHAAEYAELSDRSRLIVTYALCGFANIGSLGNQIGVLSQLAPGRARDVSRVAVSAMVTGAISTFTSAAIAGLLITNEKQYFSVSTA